MPPTLTVSSLTPRTELPSPADEVLFAVELQAVASRSAATVAVMARIGRDTVGPLRRSEADSVCDLTNRQ
ncbi:hypothetical protein GCM10010431_23210 [Streptomyces kunmingensis]